MTTCQVGRHWDSFRLSLQRGMLEAMLQASESALAMHESWLPVEEDGCGRKRTCIPYMWHPLSPLSFKLSLPHLSHCYGSMTC